MESRQNGAKTDPVRIWVYLQKKGAVMPIPKQRRLRLGIIGAGKTARWHLKAYNRISEVKVVAIANPNSERGQGLAEKHRIERHFHYFDELLEQANIDALDICAPTGLHKKIIIAALNRNLHVYVEKPMCRSVDEADEIISANRQRRRIIFNGFNYRFWPEILKIKAIIASGELGDIRWVNFVRTLKAPAVYMYDPALNTGIINELSCHFIDLMLWWGFNTPSNIDVQSTDLLDGRIHPDTVLLNLEYKNGPLVSIFNSFGIAGVYPEILIAGTKGTLKVRYGKIFMDKKSAYSLPGLIGRALNESVFVPRIFHNPFYGSCRYFTDCVLGRRINEADEYSARKILAVTALANHSLLTKTKR